MNKLEVAKCFNVNHAVQNSTSISFGDIFLNQRHQAFTEADPDYLYVEELNLPQISGQVAIIRYGQWRAGLYTYNNDKLLWLDDHLNSDNFTTFAKNENLSEWISSRPLELVQLIVRFVLPLQFTHQYIENIADIPQLNISMSDSEHSKDQRLPEELEKQRQKLMEIKNIITPLEIITANGGGANLTFYSWTKFFGLVYQNTVYKDQNNDLKLKSSQIAVGIGRGIWHL